MAKLNIIRTLLSIVANLDWPLYQLDVKNVFLNGDLEEEVYILALKAQKIPQKFANSRNLLMGQNNLLNPSLPDLQKL